MFYRPENGHGLPHNPFSAIVAPRPIGWISTRDAETGDNLAPYSFFNAVASNPPQVMFSSSSAKQDRDIGKDSLGNVRASGVFCVNVVPHALVQQMNLSSAVLPAGEDEFAHAGLEKAECVTIDCPRVAEAPAALECRLTEVVRLRGAHNFLVLGEVCGVHIDDRYLKDGHLDITAYGPVARLGYLDYAAIREVFELKRPS